MKKTTNEAPDEISEGSGLDKILADLERLVTAIITQRGRKSLDEVRKLRDRVLDAIHRPLPVTPEPPPKVERNPRRRPVPLIEGMRRLPCMNCGADVWTTRKWCHDDHRARWANDAAMRTEWADKAALRLPAAPEVSDGQ